MQDRKTKGRGRLGGSILGNDARSSREDNVRYVNSYNQPNDNRFGFWYGFRYSFRYNARFSAGNGL